MILWDREKNLWLIKNRGVSFEQAEEVILEKRYFDILENRARPGQDIFIIPLEGYTYAVPFVLDKDGNMILKTVYPSRKFHKRYGGRHETRKS